jgi:hypothetical protein
MCAFPLHAWTLILVFRDLGWMAERTNFSDALGVGAYALLFAFFEGLISFLVMTLLGFLVSTAWDAGRRIALLTVLYWITALWSMLAQTYFLANLQAPDWFLAFLIQNGHPVRVMYALAFVVIAPTLALPAWFILRSEKAVKSINAVIERLSLLSAFYLFFDLVGLVFVIVRNVW